jgi:phosphate starvation-inducible PhoH-like protein
MEDKMNPYMIPMYEVLKKYFTPLELTTIYTVGTSSYKSSPKIELVPFDFMRGLNWSKGDYVVLDEAQNATYEQIYTLITRLCDGAKIIMCGDLSQRDVDIQNGIEYFIPRLEKIQGVGVVELTEQDIVRHRIVQEIVKLLKKS